MQSMREKTPDERDLVERARRLVPALKARTAQADKDLKVPEESIAALQAAGLLRALQPRVFGGYEVDPRTFFEIQTILAEGCMSTAWVYGVMGVHPWQLARYPIEAQREVWGDDHNTLICSTYMPSAKVTVSRAATASAAAGDFPAVASTATGCCWAASCPRTATLPLSTAPSCCHARITR